jgi:hypothetical protein
MQATIYVLVILKIHPVSEALEHCNSVIFLFIPILVSECVELDEHVLLLDNHHINTFLTRLLVDNYLATVDLLVYQLQALKEVSMVL